MSTLDGGVPDTPERHLAAILAADIVGYSRRMEHQEVATLRRLRDLRSNLIEPKITEYRGRLFKTMGDGFLAEFGSVVDAVYCAVDIQRMMVARNLDLQANEQIQLRIGINLGDAFREGDDVFGDGVNIAARLESMAPPGGIYVSRGVYDPVRERLAFEFEDLGEHQVKNITRSIQVFNIRIDGLIPDMLAEGQVNANPEAYGAAKTEDAYPLSPADPAVAPAPTETKPDDSAPQPAANERRRKPSAPSRVARTAAFLATALVVIAVSILVAALIFTPPGGPRTLTGHTDTVASVAFSPDSRTLASASSDFTIKLWDLEHFQNESL